jgi:hypothetical protein
LLSAKDCFDFTFALSLMSDARRGSSGEDGENGHQRKERNECITSVTGSL